MFVAFGWDKTFHQQVRRASGAALDSRASRELHDELVKRIEDHQYGGMTEGQRTYYKRTREQHNENA
jgi:hypothetical protein